MRKLAIQSVIRKRRRDFGKSGSIVFPNLLGRNFKVQLPNKKLATDITYLPTTSGVIYLSVVQTCATTKSWLTPSHSEMALL